MIKVSKNKTEGVQTKRVRKGKISFLVCHHEREAKKCFMEIEGPLAFEGIW